MKIRADFRGASDINRNQQNCRPQYDASTLSTEVDTAYPSNVPPNHGIFTRQVNTFLLVFPLPRIFCEKPTSVCCGALGTRDRQARTKAFTQEKKRNRGSLLEEAGFDGGRRRNSLGLPLLQSGTAFSKSAAENNRAALKRFCGVPC